MKSAKSLKDLKTLMVLTGSVLSLIPSAFAQSPGPVLEYPEDRPIPRRTEPRALPSWGPVPERALRDLSTWNRLASPLPTAAPVPGAVPPVGGKPSLPDLQQIFRLGGDSSGGTDFLPGDHGSAWYLGENRIIRACIETGKDFELTRDEAAHFIEQAFETWREYIRAKRIQREDPRDMPSNRIQMEACGELTDLKFYLGSEDALVTAYKKSYYEPEAFAKRVSYSVEHGWGRGLIWTRPKPLSRSWREGETFLKTMLHEIGHALGTEHSQGTIMDPNYPHFSQNGDSKNPAIARIDIQKELAVCGECAWDYEGVIALSPERSGDFYRSVRDTFKLFTGRAPVGNPISRLSSDAVITQARRFPKITLTLRDARGSYDFEIDYVLVNAEFETDATLFKTYREDKRGLTPEGLTFIQLSGTSSHSRAGHVYFGTIRSRAGKKFDVIIERNTRNARPVAVQYFDRQPLLGKRVAFDLLTKPW